MIPALRLAPSDEPRTARLGASEVAAVLGLSRFRTPLQVWESKTGKVGASPETSVTRRGRHLEAGLLNWLGEEIGATQVVPGAPYTSPMIIGDAPHIGAHPDGFLLVDGWGSGEVKTARDDREYGTDADEVPDGYWIQTQIQLYCTGLQVCHFGVYLPMREEFRTFALPRNDGIITQIVEQAETWWQTYVVANVPPPATDPGELSRQLAYLYPRELGAMRPATDVEAEVVRSYAAAKRAEKAAILEAERIGNVVRGFIGDAAGVLVPGGKSTWTAQTATRIDVTRLRAEMPDIAEKFSTTFTSRVLRVNVKE